MLKLMMNAMCLGLPQPGVVPLAYVAESAVAAAVLDAQAAAAEVAAVASYTADAERWSMKVQ